MEIRQFLVELERRLEDRFFLKRDHKQRWQVWTYIRDKESPVERADEFEAGRSYLVHVVQTDAGGPREPSDRDIDSIQANTYANTFGDLSAREARAQIMENYYSAAAAREHRQQKVIEDVAMNEVLPYALWATKAKLAAAVKPSEDVVRKQLGHTLGKVRLNTRR